MTIRHHEPTLIVATTAAELAGRVLKEGELAYAEDDASLRVGPGRYDNLPNAGKVTPAALKSQRP